ncbi:MAG: hypothetical protein WAW31_05655 [Smithella sp.]
MEDLISRRLLLAKEFYSNAVDLCSHSDSLSKMIAVHNLHIAIEITLKAILLKYKIRSEKTLNIDFGTMLLEIDRKFKDTDKKLTYRQQIGNINQMRNMVQHSAVEPDQNAVQDWKVITRLFLEETFLMYFNADFQHISRISFIKDKLLQAYLRKAESLVDDDKCQPAACFLVAALEYAEISICKFIPRSNSSHFGFSRSRRSSKDVQEIENTIKKIEGALKNIDKRIDKSFFYSMIWATGIMLSDYGRLRSILPTIQLSINGNPNFFNWSDRQYLQDDVSWACSFVINCIIKWQSQGLTPTVQENLVPGAVKFLDETPPEI